MVLEQEARGFQIWLDIQIRQEVCSEGRNDGEPNNAGAVETEQELRTGGQDLVGPF